MGRLGNGERGKRGEEQKIPLLHLLFLYSLPFLLSPSSLRVTPG
jgi:hypothetical protein